MQTATCERPMARPGPGRPKREGEPPTRMMRASARLVDMLGWVCRAEGVDNADLLDVLLRPAVEARYLANYELIRQMKERMDETAITLGKGLSPDLPLLPAGHQPAKKPKK